MDFSVFHKKSGKGKQLSDINKTKNEKKQFINKRKKYILWENKKYITLKPLQKSSNLYHLHQY